MTNDGGPKGKGSNLPGISSVFTSTPSGLRRRRRQCPASIDPDTAPIKPVADQTTQDLDGTTDEVEPEPVEAAQQAPEQPPVAEPPAHTTSPVDDGIQLSGGLQPVDTAEISIPPEIRRRAAEMEATQHQQLAASASAAPAPAQQPPTPPITRPMEARSARHHAPSDVAPSLLDEGPQSARTEGKSISWGLVLIAVLFAIGAVGALVYYVGRMTGMF